MSLDKLSAEALAAISGAPTSKALEELRVQYLGKSGSITGELKTLGTLAPEERKTRGAEINRIRDEVTAALETKKSKLETAELDAKLSSESIDVTLPASPIARGSIHPITQ